MTPHTKAATIIAPFLLIGGYIAADYFQTSKEEKRLITEAESTPAQELVLESSCSMPAEPCVLRVNSLVIEMKADAVNYYLDSNQDLAGVTIGLAQSDRITRAIKMQNTSGKTRWVTAIRQLSNLKKDAPLLMRIALVSNNNRYYAEFPINTDGPWSAD